jgi:hypothetical protein
MSIQARQLSLKEETVEESDEEYIYSIFIKSGAGFLLASAVVIVLSEVYKICQDAENYCSNPSGYLWWMLSIVWAGTLSPTYWPDFTIQYWHFPIVSVSLSKVKHSSFITKLLRLV